MDTDKKLEKLFKMSFDKAAISLSQLTNDKVFISQYKVQVLSGEQFVNQIRDQLEEIFFASIMKVQEELDTNIVSIISKTEGLRLFNKVFRNNGFDMIEEVSDELISGIGEMNNIVGSTFVNYLANFMNKTLHCSTPMNSYDMLGAILDSIVMQQEFLNKEILCADAIIKEKSKEGYHIELIVMTDRTRLLQIVN